MKIECSCGAKYQFELRPEMKDQPVSFVCPACGVDSSAFVSSLVRRELGQSNAPEVRPLLHLSNTPTLHRLNQATFWQSRRLLARSIRANWPLRNVTFVAGHLSEMHGALRLRLFAFVQAKAGSHGINLPVYEFQKSVVEARRWRKVLWASSSAAALMFLLLGIWIWYAWFGCAPKTIFSVRFDEPSYSGQSALAGQNHDQLVFLHGATLARYDLKSRAKVWSRELLDRQQNSAGR
jgi:hypothetical protein